MCVGGDIVQLQAAGYSDVNLGGPATCTFRIDNDGGIYVSRAHFSGGAFIKQYDWVTPNGNAANYECRWVTQGNDPDTAFAASGTWVSCSVDRDLVTTTGAALDTALATVEIRLVGGATLASVTIGIDADGSP